MRLTTYLSLFSAFILFAACASLSDVTSGYVGCPANEIQTSDQVTNFSSVTWTATCRGKKFYCKQDQSNPNAIQTTCAPEVN